VSYSIAELRSSSAAAQKERKHLGQEVRANAKDHNASIKAIEAADQRYATEIRIVRTKIEGFQLGLDEAATARAALNVSVNDAVAEAGNLFEMIEGDSQDIGTIEGRVGVLEKEGAKMVSLKVLFTAFGLARIRELRDLAQLFH
jgi:hypothetical protein